jgi:hypothetical protein
VPTSALLPLIIVQVARGNTVLTLYNPDVGKKTQDMVVFALKKFTGLFFERTR